MSCNHENVTSESGIPGLTLVGQSMLIDCPRGTILTCWTLFSVYTDNGGKTKYGEAGASVDVSETRK